MTAIMAGRVLAEAKVEAQVKVDAAAEACRLKFLTPGAGQALEYLATELEARALQAAYDRAQGDEDPYSAADYPWIEAEVAALTAQLGARPPVPAVLAGIIAQANAWRTVGASIKEIRRSAKLRIEQATTIAAVDAAATVFWPEPPA